MINQVTLVGRLTREAVLRKTPGGVSVAQFTVACERRVKVEGQPTADFISCVCWNKVADNLLKYTGKGSLIGVEGKIQTRSYEDPTTKKKMYVTEVLANSVQFLSRKENVNVIEAAIPSNEYETFPSSDTLDIRDDDLPF